MLATFREPLRTFHPGELKSTIADSGSIVSPAMPSSARASSAMTRSSSSVPVGVARSQFRAEPAHIYV